MARFDLPAPPLEIQVAAAERLIAEFEGGLSELRSSEDHRSAEARLRRMRLALDMLRGQRERARRLMISPVGSWLAGHFSPLGPFGIPRLITSDHNV